MNSVGVTSDVYNRGVKNGLFRSGINPLDIHWMIASMSFFSISNKYSFNWVHNLPPYDESQHKSRKKFILDVVLNHLLVKPQHAK